MQEHEHLYLSLLRPIIGYVTDILPEDMRETNGNEFYFEDLEKLSGDDVARISEWLTEKVDALSTRLKAEPKEEEVSGWLVDLFPCCLVEVKEVWSLIGCSRYL